MTHRNHPWDVLGIDETEDKKTIKKTYAQLIKQYKPDEHPEKFQDIQQAYKLALSMQQMQMQSFDETPNDNKEVDAKTNDFKLTQHSELIHNEQKDSQQQELITNLYKQLHAMAFAPLVVKDKLENWKFIEEYYKIDDLVLKETVAKEVFAKVSEYNLFQARTNKTLLIQSNILKYFNVVFSWSSKWKEFETIFPEHYFAVTFYYFESDAKFAGILNSIATPVQRTWSFILDFFITGACYIPFLFIQTDSSTQSVIFMSLFIFIRFSSELKTKTHTSLGKKLNKLVILDEFGNYCSKKQTLLRHLTLNIFLVAIMYLPLFSIRNEKIYLFTYGFIVLINMITLITKKTLFHDYLSKTIVISQ